MTAQPSLFDAPSNHPPRCKLCARQAHWSTRHSEYTAYCRANGCQNPNRICQICGVPFTVGVDGAGTKYCSAECKQQGYHPTAGGGYLSCAWCGKQARGVHRGRVWPYICEQCREPIKHLIPRLTAHHVDHQRARRLLADQGCEICQRDIVAKVPVPRTGKYRALLVVDHDHACCPVESVSCGRCVRGFICDLCNLAAGAVRDDPSIALALADYLTRSDDHD